MQIAEGVDEGSRLKSADLSYHQGQQGVRGDVERHSEKNVGTPLIQLTAKLALLNIELEQAVTRR